MTQQGAPRGTLGTVHNAATLLELMADGPTHHQQLTELADRSGMSLATVHRLLRSLTAAGLAEQDPHSSRYGLGPELVRLAETYLARHPVLTVATPYLVELRNATGATVRVGTLVGDELVLLDRVDGHDAGGVYRDARRLLDPLDSALGRVLLAHDDDRWRSIARATGHTDAERAAWRDEPVLVHVPATLAGQFDVAAPIVARDGSVSVAIGVVGPARDTDDARLHQEVAPLVGRAASTISRTVGGG